MEVQNQGEWSWLVKRKDGIEKDEKYNYIRNNSFWVSGFKNYNDQLYTFFKITLLNNITNAYLLIMYVYVNFIYSFLNEHRCSNQGHYYP